MSEMMQQVRQAKEDAKHTAMTGEGGNPNGQIDELPEGTSPLEARSEDAEVEETSSEETSSGDGEAVPVVTPEPEELITINGREFKSQSEAIKYAEELERKAEAAELYNQGVRDALASGRSVEQPAQAEPEDNFEERFYANPKETLREVQAKATQDALAMIKAEQRKESLWNTFLSENPDIRRKDAERILAENYDTIGAMTDVSRAMKVLAQKTRAEYEEIRDLGKPRTELKKGSAQAVSPAGGTPNRVTPQKKDETPLDFISQLKKLKR